MWRAGQRLGHHLNHEQQDVRILHLGDHDPSGIDMSRDIEERLFTFLAHDHHEAMGEGSSMDGSGSIEFIGGHFRLDRLALNWPQIEEYQPPPNPAKVTDSRAASYIEEYGDQSWELDALEPSVIANLIEDAVLGQRDPEPWALAVERENEHRAGLKLAADRWSDVAAFLRSER